MSKHTQQIASSPPNAGTLAVHLLSCVDFPSLLGLQEQTIYELSGNNNQDGVLFLCEHPLCISMGREATRTDIRLDQPALEERKIPVHWLSRGGGAFSHAPGQLAAYLFLPLNQLQIGISDYRVKLETAVRDSCRELKIPAKRRDSEPGIWGRAGHLAYFGGGLRSGVTCFGMYLNVDIAPEHLSLTTTNPVNEKATSVQAQRLQPTNMAQIREAVMRHILEQFGYTDTDVSTGHPLLKRQRVSNRETVTPTIS